MATIFVRRFMARLTVVHRTGRLCDELVERARDGVPHRSRPRAARIRALIAVGAVVNPLLFLPLAWGQEVKERAAYKAVVFTSFTTMSVGLPALAVWAILVG